MANIELKFLVSLHCLATLTRCLTALILLPALASETTSVADHIISRFTSSEKVDRAGVP